MMCMDENMNSEQLDKLGKFLVEHIRDFNIDSFDELVANSYAPFFGRKLRRKVDENFTQEQLAIVRKIITYCIDDTIAELLYNLDKNNCKSDISICIDDRTVAENGDRLRMELYNDEGWIARFSKHHEEEDV
ncbi:hypothetical protein Cha6605_5556 [Chamaesiphon minutus PCC 6605]|uniref:Uncharacterized protein n=2 Tax=Chamaesiphon TaxID=217161 RepID=K9UMV7_CHAP6|nr:hypothetical protein Cha6605_5556 [Chamaesiphon minutus PCC 6605]